MTGNWTDCEISSFLIGPPVPTLSGEWLGDEEVDGRAFSNHHGHAAGLLLIGQTTGTPRKLVCASSGSNMFFSFLLSTPSSEEYLFLGYSKYTSTSVNITGYNFWKHLKSLGKHFESTVLLVFPV